MGARIRAHDWPASPFGSPAAWPASLRLTVSMMLGSSFATAIYWGPDLRLLYNDAWAALIKPAPEALARPAAEVWADIWEIIGPRFLRTFKEGEGISDHDRMLLLRRGGTVTETYWTYSLTPIREGDGTVSGLFNQADETTDRVMNGRRDALLLDLDDRLRSVGAPVEATRIATEVLGREVQAVRVGIARADRDDLVEVEHDSTAPGFDTASGRHAFVDFISSAADLHAGRTGRVDDVACGASSLPSTVRLRDALNIRAVVEAPLLRGGRLAAVLFVHDRKPRAWTDYDVQLIKAVAARAWSTIERARSEAALRESEQRFRALVKASSDAVYRMSPDWTEMRDVAGRGFGAYSTSRGHKWLQTYIDLADHPLVTEAVNEAIHSKQALSLEHRFRRIDGTVGWTHSRAVPILGPADEIVEWIGMASDITRQKQAEEERKRLLGEVQVERDRLSALLASMKDEVWFADPDQRFTLANPAALSEFALTEGEAVDVLKLAESLDVFHADGSPRSPKEAPALLALKGETVANLEEIVRTPSTSELRHRQVTATPVKDDAGEIIGSVVVVRDITKQKHAEKALRDSEERQAFLLKLSDALRPLVDATDIECTAARLVGEALQADRAYFGRIDPEARIVSITSEYLRNIGPSNAGDYLYSDFPELIQTLESGKTFVVPDIKASSLFSERTKQAYAKLGFAAVLSAPLIKAGRLVWRLTTTSITPREWTEQQVELVREVGERCWDAVQRARAESALQESEERFRVSFAHASIGFCVDDAGRAHPRRQPGLLRDHRPFAGRASQSGVQATDSSGGSRGEHGVAGQDARLPHPGLRP